MLNSIIMDSELIERFWANILKRDDGHWIWKGSLTKKRTRGSYGRIMYRGKSIYAVRLSYAIFHNKEIEDIDHLEMKKICPVKECVNPAHLVALPRNYTGE
jgi:hypothetical protein